MALSITLAESVTTMQPSALRGWRLEDFANGVQLLLELPLPRAIDATFVPLQEVITGKLKPVTKPLLPYI